MSEPIVIAGAGIAGLTAALAFAQRGQRVRIFERSPKLAEAGAGLQLSPNATRILDRLGVLQRLRPSAVQPEAVVLRGASNLRQLTHVPLGKWGEARWEAPYLVAHRADLQQALLTKVQDEPAIRLDLGVTAQGYASDAGSALLSTETPEGSVEIPAALLVAADGVWSKLRQARGPAKSRFTGQIAWRRTVAADSAEGKILAELGATDVVTAFLHSRFHLIAYPVRGGERFNLAAFTPGQATAESWSERGDAAALKKAMRRADPRLASLSKDGAAWTFWPIHTVETTGPWTSPGFALIGDAAHAMTPFAAQGAAMAIEDAETLAEQVCRDPGNLPAALSAWENLRRPRIAQVNQRGRINRFAWHAPGPIALARNLFLRLRSPEKLAADMDWLYGWDQYADRPSENL